MRGSPILQTIVLLAVMIVAGWLGKSYLHSGPNNTHVPAENNTEQVTANDHLVDAEVELIFSSAPKSYTLKQTPAKLDGEPKQLLTGGAPEENPVYSEIKVSAHQTVTYWLDVTWEEQPADGQRHFVQMRISPNFGEAKEVAYSTTSSEINQTLEFNTGEEHHHHE